MSHELAHKISGHLVKIWVFCDFRKKSNQNMKFCYTIKRAVSRERTVSFSAPCQDTGFGLNEDSLGGWGRIFMRPKTCIETRQGKSNCPSAKKREFNLELNCTS